MVNDITLYNENFTLYLKYVDYKAKYDVKNNDVFIEMINELDYFPIPYVNKELLSDTIEFSFFYIFLFVLILLV